MNDDFKEELKDCYAKIERLRAALEQAKLYVERDETAHGRQFGTGNAIRAALAQEKLNGIRPDRRTNVAERLFGDD